MAAAGSTSGSTRKTASSSRRPCGHACANCTATPSAAPIGALLRDTVAPSTAPRLQLADFPHLADALAILRPYLAQAVAGNRHGVNVFVHGAPGTGKSELARALAAAFGCELFEVASEDEDGDPVTGERRLRADRAAQSFFGRRHALPMIDEVDSILRDRDGARQSWEVTRVNEMLTRMENFGGVFVASTNLMGDIDPAALRRFDLKIRFGYLAPDQAALLLVRHCAGLEIAAPLPRDVDRVRRLGMLAPGDFAALVRRHRFTPFADAAGLVAALEQECALKHGRQAAIGFLA